MCHFVNSGSEANELALRIGYGQLRGIINTIVLDHAYHGNTSSLISISPYKFNGNWVVCGKPEHVEVIPVPDVFRGEFNNLQTSRKSGMHKRLRMLVKQSRGMAQYVYYRIIMLGCGGQVLLPHEFLKESFQYVRAAGGICISDEIQVGLGRVGSHYWGFELQNIIPDIVTIGKPLGNGHPIAAVVTTTEIANTFQQWHGIF